VKGLPYLCRLTDSGFPPIEVRYQLRSLFAIRIFRPHQVQPGFSFRRILFYFVGESIQFLDVHVFCPGLDLDIYQQRCDCI
jgi:hypothetical protein